MSSSTLRIVPVVAAVLVAWAHGVTGASLSAPDLVKVPAGPFVMGDHDGQYDEKPPRRVELAAFSIMRTEVTQAAYLACVQAQRCEVPKILAASPQHPVVGVTWKDAKAFCQWRGGALPTEAQWEKAARGTDRRRYPWGARDKRAGVGRANCMTGCRSDKRDGTKTKLWPHAMPVGGRKDGASPSGALDMAGNVEEWVADWYGEGAYHDMPEKDPTGPMTGVYKAVRGGEFSQPLDVLRASNRYWADPRSYNDRRGFRCVL